MPNDIITEDGDLVSSTTRQPSAVDMTAMVGLAKAEIDMQIATARQYPRSIDRAIKAITNLATLDETTAEECCYALVRKKKKGADGEAAKAIEGPSIRLAEIAAQSWGNCRIDARVVAVNRIEKYVEAEGIFHDLESNMASRATVRRSISTSAGGVFSADMIVVTGNAACSIAKRNAILAGIPRGVYRPAYTEARKIIAGTVVTLSENRGKAIAAFANYAVTPDQLFAALGVEGEGDLRMDHIATLRAMYAAIRNGEATVEEMFSHSTASTHKVVANPLSDEAPAAPAEPARPDPAAAGADAPKTAPTSPAAAPAQPTTTNPPIAADASPGSGGQSDPEQPLPDVRSGSAPVQAADDDFPGDRPAVKAGRKFLRNIVEGE